MQVLSDSVLHRRNRVYSEALEESVVKLIELGVAARKGKVIKEALHQFRNACQNSLTSTTVLERVVRGYVVLVETELARRVAEREANATGSGESLELEVNVNILWTLIE